MGRKKIVKRVTRARTSEEKKRHAAIRAQAKNDFPPAKIPRLKPATTGIGAEIRKAREAKGLTWYSLAKLAGIPNSTTIRNIEYGRDVKLSNVEAIAKALGQRVELVEA